LYADSETVFAAFFIAGFASTWGPLVWTVVGELYPSRYRAMAMGMATSSNWIWNFLISFFTPFITGAIDFRYGYVFAAMCFTGAVFVYFFVCETQGRTLEEIDTMYLSGVQPWKSSKWQPTEGENIRTLDDAYRNNQGKIHKNSSDGTQHHENVLDGRQHGAANGTTM
jgi:MFS transporter, SP family, sugar:H+ symporter